MLCRELVERGDAGARKPETIVQNVLLVSEDIASARARVVAKAGIATPHHGGERGDGAAYAPG